MPIGDSVKMGAFTLAKTLLYPDWNSLKRKMRAYQQRTRMQYSFILKNTLLDLNTIPTLTDPFFAYDDCFGAPTSLGYNLVFAPSGCTFGGAHDLTGVHANLGSLTDNGGILLTHALISPSPAVDGGKPSGCLDNLGA